MSACICVRLCILYKCALIYAHTSTLPYRMKCTMESFRFRFLFINFYEWAHVCCWCVFGSDYRTQNRWIDTYIYLFISRKKKGETFSRCVFGWIAAVLWVCAVRPSRHFALPHIAGYFSYMVLISIAILYAVCYSLAQATHNRYFVFHLFFIFKFSAA